MLGVVVRVSAEDVRTKGHFGDVSKGRVSDRVKAEMHGDDVGLGISKIEGERSS